jgi:hypothetical protein
LLAECKNIRESTKKGGADYRKGGKVVAYKVESQDSQLRFHDKLEVSTNGQKALF